MLPHDLLYRPKMGFAVPLARWFRGPLRQRVRDALLGERLAATGLFNRRYLEHLVERHKSGARDYSAPLWTLLMFDAFLRNVVQDDAPRVRRGADERCAEQRSCGGGEPLSLDSAHARSFDPAAQRLHVPDARDPARAAAARVGDLPPDEPEAHGARRGAEEDVDGLRLLPHAVAAAARWRRCADRARTRADARDRDAARRGRAARCARTSCTRTRRC